VQVIFSSVPTLAVSAIYCLWHLHLERRLRRDRLLRQRVAYMLWAAANEMD
jgi:hypothetical protein